MWFYLPNLEKYSLRTPLKMGIEFVVAKGHRVLMKRGL